MVKPRDSGPPSHGAIGRGGRLPAAGVGTSHDPAIERGLAEQVFFKRARGDCSAECLALAIVQRVNPVVSFLGAAMFCSFT